MIKKNDRLVYLYGSQADFNEPEDARVEGLASMRVFADGLLGKVMKLSDAQKLIRKEARRFCKAPEIQLIKPWGLIEVYLNFGDMVRKVPLIHYANEVLVRKRVEFGRGKGGFAPFFGGVPACYQKVSEKLAGKTLVLRAALDQYQDVASQFGGRHLITVNDRSFQLIVYSGERLTCLEVIQFDKVGKIVKGG